jgi:hypothetical protein
MKLEFAWLLEALPRRTNHRVTESTEKNTEKKRGKRLKKRNSAVVFLFLFLSFSVSFSVFSVTLWLVLLVRGSYLRLKKNGRWVDSKKKTLDRRGSVV